MIIAACPAVNERQRLAVPQGMHPNLMHATVLYFDESLITAEDTLKISGILRDVTSQHDAFSITASELSRFENVKRAWAHDGRGGGYIPINPTDAVTLVLKSPELHKIREELKAAMDKEKIPYSKVFRDFKPHITLKYVPHEQEVILPYALPLDFKIRGLELWDDNNHIFYPFK